MWNSVVYEAVSGNTHHIDMVRDSTADELEAAVVVSHLIARKSSLFGGDHWLIGEYKLARKHGEMRLRVEARDPRSTTIDKPR